MLKWSLHDKKLTEKTISKYGEHNRRILEHVKLFSLGTSIGDGFRHLNHLKTDDSSKKLGFHLDASLKMNVGECLHPAPSLEVMNPEWIDQLRLMQHSDGVFAVLKFRDTHVLKETRTYVPLPQTPHKLDCRTQARVDELARLLRQPKEQVFRIPRCIGWKYVSLQSRIAFLFEIPQNMKPEPVSLITLLEDRDIKVSLGGKFQLAHGLAKCIAQLHMVRWVSILLLTSELVLIPPGS